jgi:hypothetical protein
VAAALVPSFVSLVMLATVRRQAFTKGTAFGKRLDSIVDGLLSAYTAIECSKAQAVSILHPPVAASTHIPEKALCRESVSLTARPEKNRIHHPFGCLYALKDSPAARQLALPLLLVHALPPALQRTT